MSMTEDVLPVHSYAYMHVRYVCTHTYIHVCRLHLGGVYRRINKNMCSDQVKT